MVPQADDAAVSEGEASQAQSARMTPMTDEAEAGSAQRARMMRLFVAVFPPADAIADLTAALSTIDIRVPAAERLHITLAFLGDQPDAGPAIAALDAGMAGEAGGKPLGELAIQGGGRFGSILWAGIAGDIAGLTKLTRLVRRSLRAHRVQPDDKRFRPHLTLARRLSHEAVGVGVGALHDYEGPAWPVREIVLVHSVLGSQPVYHPVKTWPLPRRS
ncbi:RNA 2',3'-cyclic phosphodiesterase [Allorhizocola rhizosphaerae]|uniref:RNA 2',3'-cyclic phosphodiesterase n=1 Tax=Allorhizocola rhizosphaerae TaxID=1872709 RepID=UPI000E3D5F92|nr:RNA 2',3'-cyclic phosphodiesterase [Allorhizocola rhizosphaerae]